MHKFVESKLQPSHNVEFTVFQRWRSCQVEGQHWLHSYFNSKETETLCTASITSYKQNRPQLNVHYRVQWWSHQKDCQKKLAKLLVCSQTERNLKSIKSKHCQDILSNNLVMLSVQAGGHLKIKIRHQNSAQLRI